MRFACLRYASCYSLYICTRAFGLRYGVKLLLEIERRNLRYNTKHICHVNLALICTSDYPSIHVGTTSLGQVWNLFTFHVVNNNIYLSHVVDNIIFWISVPDYPSRTVETWKQLSTIILEFQYILFTFIHEPLRWLALCGLRTLRVRLRRQSSFNNKDVTNLCIFRFGYFKLWSLATNVMYSVFYLALPAVSFF